MALYVAMIMLLLLSLIGVAAMQVTTLQQRMSVSYNDFAMAFQRAEGSLRQSEFELQRQIDADPNRVLTFCVVNANAWSEPVEPGAIPAVSVRELTGGASCAATVGGGNPMAEGPSDNRRFQLVAAAADRDASASPSAVVVVETVFEVPPAVLVPPAGP
jgi:type IV pilus assembly protein PilX